MYSSINTLRKKAGQLIFNRFLQPPEYMGPKLLVHTEDYGHAHLYEPLFCPGSKDIQAALEMSGSGRGPILDLAGGTGRFSLLAAKAKKFVTLVDNSKSMLKVAEVRRETLEGIEKSYFRIYEQDIRKLELKQKFSHVFSIRNGMEHVGNEKMIIRTLGQLHRLLLPKATVYFEVHNPNYWQSQLYWKTGRWNYCMDKNILSNRYRVWERTFKGTSEDKVHWEHAVSTDQRTYTLLRTQLHLYTPPQWKKMIEAADFELIAYWADWHRRPLTPYSPKIVLAVRSPFSI